MANELVPENLEKANSLCNAIGAMVFNIAKGTDDYVLISSWKPDTMEGLKRLERHECDVEEKSIAFLNVPVEIVAFSLRPYTKTDERGEIKFLPALTLELKDGQLFTTMSATALKSFTSRLRTHLAGGDLGQKRPIALKLVQVESANAAKDNSGPMRYYWFDRV